MRAPGRGVGDAWVATRAAERARRDAAGELPARSEVERLIERNGLAEHRDKVLAAIRPGYWLLPGDAPRTRIGGLPDLAPGERWPHGADGIPYTFVAQIDCSALPPMKSEFPLPEWGHGGALVRIFAALDARVPEPGPAVALACPPGAPVARAEVPPRPDPMPADAWEPDDDSLRRLHELPVRLVPFLGARVGWYAGIPPSASEDYDDFARRLAAGGHKPRAQQWRLPHLLGHGETLQGEDSAATGESMLPEVPRDEWCTLINIPEHEGMSFGDGGGLAIVIPIADLAAGRYDRLVTDLSMY